MSLIKNLSDDDKPREKLETHGSKTLSNAELIAILIGSGSREMNAVELSRLILESVGNNLEQLATLTLDDLQKFKGIGKAKAITIASALELGRRRKTETKPEQTKISCSDDIYQLLHSHLMDLGHEEFWIICLNHAHKVISCEQISKGGFSATVVDAKLVFKTALDKKASSIVLAHNHPSGNLNPSTPDKALTEKLKQGGQMMDIKVLDHVIYTNNGYFSFADDGIL